jgi:hypothetical protein
MKYIVIVIIVIVIVVAIIIIINSNSNNANNNNSNLVIYVLDNSQTKSLAVKHKREQQVKIVYHKTYTILNFCYITVNAFNSSSFLRICSRGGSRSDC